MEKLHDILSTRREHDSLGEQDTIDRYIKPLNPTPMYQKTGEVAAYYTRIKHKDGTHSPIMWSCHTDTMHRGEPETIRQEVYVDVFGVMFVDEGAGCLGADNGAGMWLLLEMIQAGVPGTYMFHRGEEKSCWGSRGVVEHYPEFLAEHTHAIAFDRKGTTSVITHQMGGRACSDDLGEALCALFGDDYILDTTGVYTDTAEYVDIIPECVNVSIGYMNEHSSNESLDSAHCVALRDRILAINWCNIALPVTRDPSAERYEYGQTWGNGWGNAKDGWNDTTMNLAPTIEDALLWSEVDVEEWMEYCEPAEASWMVSDLLDEVRALRNDRDFRH